MNSVWDLLLHPVTALLLAAVMAGAGAFLLVRWGRLSVGCRRLLIAGMLFGIAYFIFVGWVSLGFGGGHPIAEPMPAIR